MTFRVQTAIAVAICLIILPAIIVQAQSQGETEVPAGEEVGVVEQRAADMSQRESASTTEQGTAEGAPSSAPGESPAAEGEVLGESDLPVEEAAEPAESATTTMQTEESVAFAASSTEATSTPPVVEEAKSIEEPFVLQPGVELSINGNIVSAAISLQNLTCKSCDKVLPELEVFTYYTEWYPNDGPISDYSQAGVHSTKQARSVGDLANGASRDLTWSAEIPPGHYYFVVEVDPENTNGAYRLFRAEFAI